MIHTTPDAIPATINLILGNIMRRQIQAEKGKDRFPESPVDADDLLVPITCWSGIYRESQITGIEFDQFWYESVEERVAYFFSWLGSPRSTVLVIWDEESLVHIECRTLGDLLVSEQEAEPIVAKVVNEFRQAGFWQDRVLH